MSTGASGHLWEGPLVVLAKLNEGVLFSSSDVTTLSLPTLRRKPGSSRSVALSGHSVANERVVQHVAQTSGVLFRRYGRRTPAQQR
jgi:hypothetical protein